MWEQRRLHFVLRSTSVFREQKVLHVARSDILCVTRTFFCFSCIGPFEAGNKFLLAVCKLNSVCFNTCGEAENCFLTSPDAAHSVCSVSYSANVSLFPSGQKQKLIPTRHESKISDWDSYFSTTVTCFLIGHMNVSFKSWIRFFPVVFAVLQRVQK